MKNKLWLLLPVDGSPEWEPWFDKAFGFVVQAPDEGLAREVADRESGDENRDGTNPWLTPALSTCVELVPDESGPALIMRDFHAA